MRENVKVNIVTFVAPAIAFAVLMVLAVFLFKLPLNFASGYFQTALVITGAIAVTFGLIFYYIKTENSLDDYDDAIGQLIFAGIYALLIVVISAVWLFSSVVFNSKEYASITEFERVSFEDAIPSEDVGTIALMDTETAKAFGDRTLGQLTDLVSVYNLKNYTTTAINGQPIKVSPLEYASVFKYMAVGKDGIPGYVKVDPVNMTAEYVQSEKMYYGESSAFAHNVARMFQFHNLTAIYGEIRFEVADDGTCYYVAPILQSQIGICAKVPTGVSIMNAHTGEIKDYSLDEVPEWVDVVYDGDMSCKLFDYYGKYNGGFWNSIFAQKNCTETTDDYGYKIIGNDVYTYTGVTSTKSTSTNASAVGFVLVNERTGEMKYMEVSGAEEHSAMAAAEGEVSDYGWKASFPSIIKVNGQPAFIMVLKDESNIVKRYAMVNVVNYTQIAIGDSSKDVLNKYNAMVNGTEYVVEEEVEVETEVPDDSKTARITVSDIQFIVNGGNTTVYVTDSNGNVYRQAFTEDWILIQVGDTVKVTYTEGEISQIYTVTR